MICTSLWERIRGLLGRPELGPGEALLLDPCKAVHTIGMRYPIDIVFLDADNRVVRIKPAMKPLRNTECRQARRVIEFKAGEAARLGIDVGCTLDWMDGSPV
ncbi:hypothetical protein B1806_04260 [Metallibacterium scheffleri]|uniref:DUF192 domain-containing protein n=2 Tax=Metallibacterium scheffleri TaxID=993689 RepID=A0A4S3KQR5_9GAMM|nr:hypothetical protein B1806_04260 [Metallibacterium scheffleri]